MTGDGGETHAWSEGASRGMHTLKLDSLADGQTRLISSAPLGDQPGAAALQCLQLHILLTSMSASDQQYISHGSLRPSFAFSRRAA